MLFAAIAGRRSVLLVSMGVVCVSGLAPWAGAEAPPPTTGPAAGPAPDTRVPRERILSEAQRIVGRSKDSQYSNKAEVDDAAGMYNVDSAGFLTLILKTVAPEQLKAVPTPEHAGAPSAGQYYDVLHAAPPDSAGKGGWRQMVKVQDVRPGDVLAFPGTDEKSAGGGAGAGAGKDQKGGKGTAHLMVVEKRAAEDGPGLFKIAVIDSTETPHADDTRLEGRTGVGRGTVWVTADEAGKITGYRWSDKAGPLVKAPVVVGRAVVLPKS